MSGTWSGHKHTLSDVLSLSAALEETYGVRVRLSIVPFAEARGKATHALLVTPYTRAGKKLQAVQAEQHLWPTRGHKEPWSLYIKLLYGLEGALDTWAHERLREEQAGIAPASTPLDEHIAMSLESTPLGA